MWKRNAKLGIESIERVKDSWQGTPYCVKLLLDFQCGSDSVIQIVIRLNASP